MTEIERCYRIIKHTPKEEGIKMIAELRTEDEKDFWDELLKKINNGRV